jgi:hypothetical protein
MCVILRKSQAKGCVNMGTPNITTPPHSTITQVTIQIPKLRANYRTKIPFMYLLTFANLHDPYTNNTISEPITLFRLHPQMAIDLQFYIQ